MKKTHFPVVHFQYRWREGLVHLDNGCLNRSSSSSIAKGVGGGSMQEANKR